MLRTIAAVTPTGLDGSEISRLCLFGAGGLNYRTATLVQTQPIRLPGDIRNHVARNPNLYLLPDLRTLFLWLTFPAVLQSGAGQLVPPLGDRPPEKTGSAPELSLTSSPQIVWRFDDHGNAPGLSDVAAVHGMLFFGDDNGVVRALAAKQGMKIWSHNHGERIFYAPTSDGERLFFTSGRGLTALQAASGLLLWHHPIEHGAGRCVASRERATRLLRR